MKYYQFTSKTEPALNDPLWLIFCKTKQTKKKETILIRVAIKKTNWDITKTEKIDNIDITTSPRGRLNTSRGVVRKKGPVSRLHYRKKKLSYKTKCDRCQKNQSEN